MSPWNSRFGAHGNLDCDRVPTEAIDDGLLGGEEIGPDPVHLVDEADTRDAVLVGLAPDGLRLGLNTGHRVEHSNGAVEHPKRPLHLDGEVDVPGCVDDVDDMVVPGAGGCGRRDRDAALLLLLHPIHDGRALMDFTQLVGASRVVEDPLRDRGLARVDVGHDPDVADLLEVDGACHEVLVLLDYQR